MFDIPSDYEPSVASQRMKIAEGLAQWLRSLPPNTEVPGSIPGLVED